MCVQLLAYLSISMGNDHRVIIVYNLQVVKVSFVLSIAQKGEKHDEANFHTINVHNAMLGSHVSKLNSMSQNPHLPRSLYRRPQIGMNLGQNRRRHFSIGKPKKGKVANHKDGTEQEKQAGKSSCVRDDKSAQMELGNACFQTINAWFKRTTIELGPP